MWKDEAERVIGLTLTLAMLVYVLMVLYALLPKWKKEQIILWLRLRSSQKMSGEWETEAKIREFRRAISRWDHEQAGPCTD